MRAVTLIMLLMALPGKPGFAQQPPLPFQISPVEISGYWENLFHEDLWDRRSGLMVGDFTGLPLNDAGRLAARSWEPGWFAIPEEQCRPHTGIYGLRGPAQLFIERQVDPDTQELIAYHVFWSLGQERTIWMDGRPHPPAYAPHSFAGFSTGRWEGNMLVVKTTHIKAGYHQRNGPPHSDQAITTEYWTRQGDTLQLISFIDDPGYLEEPLIRTTNWRLDPARLTGGFGEYSCGPFQIGDETISRPKHFVPHYLPGEEEPYREFQTMYRIPPDAAFGGSRTLYPEYMATVQALRESLFPVTDARPRGARPAPGQPGFIGTWTLNRGKSEFVVSWQRLGLDGRDGSAPERRTMRIMPEPDGSITHVTDTQIVANDTGFLRVEYTFKLNGEDAPAKGGAIETFSLRRVDDRTFERIGKVRGQVVETATWKLSPDGNTLTITAKGSVAAQNYSNTQVFERLE